MRDGNRQWKFYRKTGNAVGQCGQSQLTAVSEATTSDPRSQWLNKMPSSRKEIRENCNNHVIVATD